MSMLDAHQHFWKYNSGNYEWIDDSMGILRRDFLPSDLEPELLRNGFDGSIAVQARQTLEETQWLLELAQRSNAITGVVGWVDLRSDEAHSQLRAFAANPKLVGIRHVVQAEPDDRFLLQSEFLRGISMLEEFDLAYDILIYARHLPVAAEFVARFPRQRFVLDHLAKPDIKGRSIDSWADGMRQLSVFPNVFCKLSGIVSEADWQAWTPSDLNPYLDVAFECFGLRRLMIGSDWPVCLLAASYSRTVNVVRDYVNARNPEAQDSIMGGNARKFYGRYECLAKQ